MTALKGDSQPQEYWDAWDIPFNEAEFSCTIVQYERKYRGLKELLSRENIRKGTKRNPKEFSLLTWCTLTQQLEILVTVPKWFSNEGHSKSLAAVLGKGPWLLYRYDHTNGIAVKNDLCLWWISVSLIRELASHKSPPNLLSLMQVNISNRSIIPAYVEEFSKLWHYTLPIASCHYNFSSAIPSKWQNKTMWLQRTCESLKWVSTSHKN